MEAVRESIPARESANTELLREIVHYRTYADILPDGRKETRSEVITRVKEMHEMKFPKWDVDIDLAFDPVYESLAVPSMRTMQFAGMPIFRSNARAFNCSYCALTSWKDFADLFWLLMNGVGAGYSVQQHHIAQLPVIWGTHGEGYDIPDSKEGWAEALRHLLGNPYIDLRYHLIRAKGSKLSSGGTASGPESLRSALNQIRNVLLGALGRRLTSIEAHDIMCIAADVVAVGGVRRAALISLFSMDDEDMLRAKHGSWWETHPYRARANNSVVILRSSPTAKADLRLALDRCFESGCGEPGIYLTNDLEYGINPCAEISLRNRQMCNLTEINAAACRTPEKFLTATRTAAILGTLQAAYTDFDYLHPDWKKNCDEEALLGISITGQAQAWDLLSTPGLLRKAAQLSRDVNFEWAEKLGINPAARLTTTKPSGNTSGWLGTTSGIHAAHAKYYLRRIRIDRKDEFGKYLIEQFGEAPANSRSFIESDKFSDENIIVTLPINMTGAIQREEESAVELMERARFIHTNWIRPGHIDGPNTHNVSLTVSYKPEEQEEVADWMVANADSWSGISLLPYDGGIYEQAPFEEISDVAYEAWLSRVPEIDFKSVRYRVRGEDEDTRAGDVACAAGACEIF